MAEELSPDGARSNMSDDLLLDHEIKTENEIFYDDYGGIGVSSQESGGSAILDSYIKDELPNLLPEVNGIDRDAFPTISYIPWFTCTRCCKLLNIAESQVVSSRHPSCITNEGFSCPVCCKVVPQATDFDLHLEFHCWMKNSNSTSCDSCGKEYLLFSDPTLKLPEFPVINGILKGAVENAVQAAKEPEIIVKKKRGRPRKAKNAVPQKNNEEKESQSKPRGRPRKNAQEKTQKVQSKMNSMHGQPQSRSSNTSRTVIKRQKDSAQKVAKNKSSEINEDKLPDVKESYMDGLTCSICNKTFTRPRTLNVHMMIHTGDRPAHCDLCDMKFRTNSELKRHKASKHTENDPEKSSGTKEFPCMVCNKVFTTKDSLRNHMIVHAGVKRHKCDICDKSFSRPSDVKKHKLSHEAPGQKCEVCGKVMSRKDSLMIHMRIHTGEKPFKCRYCDDRFYCQSHRSSHERFRHLGQKRDYSKRKEPSDLYCEICGKRFSRRTSLRDHMATHTGNRPFMCDICGKGFIRMNHLRDHKRYHEEPTLQCSQCGKMFHKKIRLTEHLRLHAGEQPYMCDECGKTFYTEGSLKKHLRSHSVVAKCCPLCNKSVKNLSRHVKIHSSQKTFNCQKCSRSFYNPLELKLHRYSEHLGKKWPFTCPVCDKPLSNQRSLDRHMQSIHSQGKPFICNVCPERFLSKSNLQIHQRVHGVRKTATVSEDNYHCVVCNQRFVTATRLLLHKVSHGRYKPHKCSFCKRNYVTRSLVARHATQKHLKITSHTTCYLCGESFPEGWQLQSHTRTLHHVDTPHKCFLCPRRLRSAKEFVVHSRLHTGHKAFMCTQCGRAYRTSSSLHCHRIIVHSNMMTEDNKTSDILDQTSMKLSVSDPSTLMLHFMCDRVRAYVSSCPPGDGMNRPKLAEQRDHILLSLTILRNFLVAGNPAILDFIEQNSMVDLLRSLLSTNDAFVRRSTAEVLAQWIHVYDAEAPIQLSQSLLSQMTPDTETPQHAVLANLHVFLSLFSKTDILKSGVKDRVLRLYTLLLDNVHTMFRSCMFPVPQDEDFASCHLFLSLWDKLVEYFLTHRLNLIPHQPEIQQEANKICVLNNHLLSLLEDGQLAPACICPVLSMFSRSLPYGAYLSTDKNQVTSFHVRLSTIVLKSFDSGQLTAQLPLVTGPETFGAIKYISRRHQSLEGSIVSHRALRSAMLLAFKSVAILMIANEEGKSYEGYQCPSSPVQSLYHLQSQLCTLTKTTQPKLWIFGLCQDQYDVLIETLLCLLDIVLMAHKVAENTQWASEDNTEWLVSEYNPHKMFLQFLSSIVAWDHQVVLRHLLSPVTYFTQYFISYLEHLTRDWICFCSVCHNMSAEIQTCSETGNNQNSPLVDHVMSFFRKLRFDNGTFAVKNLKILKLLEICDKFYHQHQVSC